MTPKNAWDPSDESMVELALVASSSLDLDLLLPRICQAAKDTLGVAVVAIFFLDGHGDLKLVASTMPDTHLGLIISVRQAGFVAGRAMREQRALYDNKIPPGRGGQIERLQEALPPIRAAMAAPIVVGVETVGIFTVGSDRAGHFDAHGVRQATLVAQSIASALQNARLLQHEQALAAHLRQIDVWRLAFLRVISHEIRNPIGQVTGFLGLLDREADRLSERGRLHLSYAQQAADKLLPLMQRSLDLLALYAEDAQIEHARLDLHDVLDQVLPAYVDRAERNGIHLQVNRSADPPIVIGDQQRLQQLTEIFLDSALKYTPSNGKIELSLERRDNVIDLGFWNNGPDIPDDVRQDLLGHDSVLAYVAHSASGPWLDLLLARRIAELHRGKLSLDPPGHGTRFTLELPSAST